MGIQVWAYNKIIFIFTCLLVIVFILCGCNMLTPEEAYQKGFEEGYNSGHSDAMMDFEGVDVYKEYNEIDCMDIDEILTYLEERDQKYWSNEEVYNIFVYGFLRGYKNCQNGIWDEMTQEFLYVYDFEVLQKKYEDIFY